MTPEERVANQKKIDDMPPAYLNPQPAEDPEEIRKRDAFARADANQFLRNGFF
jgi:hypothetical protein